MKELIEILLAFLAIAALLYLYLKVAAILDVWHERNFGPWHRWGRRRTNIELQTLFHGNKKDDDQI